jgi:hypothetical protein
MVWIGAALAIILFAIWLVPASRGASVGSNQLVSPLRHLLTCNLEVALLTVRPKFSQAKFVQFARYQADDGAYGLELAFPNAPWSEDFFPKVVTAASRQGLPYEIEEAEGDVARFVFVKFGGSVESAAEFAKTILNEIFNYAPDYQFRVRIN